MSKRRKKNKPNIPQATLDRARRQAGIEPEEQVNETAEDTSSSESSSDDSSSSSSSSSSMVERAARRRKLSPVQLERSRRSGELDNDVIQEMLANPTDFVSEEQMREEYQYVLFDLRNMGILAAVLMVFLVALAQFI